MTAPVQEPTQGRQDAGQEFRTRQLYRRPSTSSPAVTAVSLLEATSQGLSGEDAITWTDDGSSPGFLDLSSADVPEFAGGGMIVAQAWILVEGISNRRLAAYMSAGGTDIGRVFNYGYNDGYAQSSGASEVGAGYFGFTPSGTDVTLSFVVNNFAVAADTVHGRMTVYKLSSVEDF